jgi:hypothetical protein
VTVRLHNIRREAALEIEFFHIRFSMCSELDIYALEAEPRETKRFAGPADPSSDLKECPIGLMPEERTARAARTGRAASQYCSQLKTEPIADGPDDGR